MARTKYVEDIRKIVKIDVNQKTLGAADRRSTIDAKKGVAYNTAQVGNGGGSRPVGTDQNGSNWEDWFDDGSLDTEDTSDGDDQGNSQDPAQPNRGSYGYDQGTWDIGDIIDNESGTPNLPDGVPQGLQGRPLNNGGTLNGITGAIDCESGKELDIRMDKLMRPPEGWRGIDDPGDVTGPNGFDVWEAGRQWVGSHLSNPTATSARPAAEAARDAAGDGDKTILVSTELDANFPHTGGVLRWIFTWKNPSEVQASYYAYDQGCTASSSDPDCPLVNPTKWPTDGKMQIVLNSDGSYKAATLESPEDIIPKYTDNLHSRINFCFGDGRFGSIIPAINGGYIIAETVTEGGILTGTGKLFNSQNKVIAYVNDLNYQNFLPR